MKRFYCLFGDAINMAARLSSKASPGHILCSSQVVQALQRSVQALQRTHDIPAHPRNCAQKGGGVGGGGTSKTFSSVVSVRKMSTLFGGSSNSSLNSGSNDYPLLSFNSSWSSCVSSQDDEDKKIRASACPWGVPIEIPARYFDGPVQPEFSEDEYARLGNGGGGGGEGPRRSQREAGGGMSPPPMSPPPVLPPPILHVLDVGREGPEEEEGEGDAKEGGHASRFKLSSDDTIERESEERGGNVLRFRFQLKGGADTAEGQGQGGDNSNVTLEIRSMGCAELKGKGR